MYIHLGQDTVVSDKDVIGIFDLDNATVAKATRTYLSAKEKEKKVVTVSFDLPRSFTVCAGAKGERETVYLSPLSPGTLEKRANNSGFLIMMKEER
jgi:hypothetical protein